MKLEMHNGKVVDPSITNRCPDCGQRTLDEWTHCPHCGAEL